MKFLIPVILVVLGLGAGVGAGLALKPAPEPAKTACGEEGHEASGDGHAEEMADDGHGAPADDGHGDMADAGCDDSSDPFAMAPSDGGGHGDDADAPAMTYVPMEKPFVVPVFAGEKISSMVVVSLSIETSEGAVETLKFIQPRLRDRLLKVMFLHSNSGGFDGSFTSGRKMSDLKSALLKAAREVLAKAAVKDILITDIARQDV